MADYDKWIDKIGEVVLSDTECFWMLPRHMFLNKRLCISSPWFSHEGERWRLVKTPKEGDNNYICMYLWKKIPRKLPEYIFKLYLKSYSQFEIIASYTGNISDFGDVCYEFFNLLDPEKVKTASSCGLVKLFFEIRKRNSVVDSNPTIGSPDGEDNQAHMNDKNGKSSHVIETSSDEVETSSDESEDSSDEENAEKKRFEDNGIKKLLENFRQLFLDGRVSDIVLTVDSREFKVHKAILVARSPVFSSMFQHDMAENNENKVDIPDCKAESFEVFLHYLYSGSVESLSTSNVYNVYYAAEKYQVDDLKEKCVNFMKKNLSAETFCDVIALSLRHGESELKDAAVDFFCRNFRSIIRTIQWQNYLAENPTQANELFIKASGDNLNR